MAAKIECKSHVLRNYLVIPLHMLYFVILLIAPCRRSVVAIIAGVLLIPTGNRADWSLLSKFGIRDVVGSLSLVMLVHLSKLKLELLVGYLSNRKSAE